jgi:integrase
MPTKPKSRSPQPNYTKDLPAIPNSVISFDRQFINTRGDRWVVRQAGDGGDQLNINWDLFAFVTTNGGPKVRVPARTVHIARLYASDRLTRKAGYTVHNDIYSLHLFLEQIANSEQSSARNLLNWAAIDESHFRSFLDHVMLTPNRGSHFHRVRVFYSWGVQRRIPGFDPDLLGALKTINAPGNLHGQHVLSQDPTKGPLYREEVELVVAALSDKKGTPQDRAVVMLLLELGLNPNQAARLRNQDLVSFNGDINGSWHTEYQLHVPRNKKRKPFRETKNRAISHDLGALLKELQLGKPSSRLLHWLPTNYPVRAIYRALRRFACDSNLVSPRTGTQLHLHPRRLRYTLATEAAEQGASDYHVAELLDHSDTNHVKVYRKTEPTIADRMERTLDPALAPLVKRFLGQIVDSTGEYPFGNIPPAPVPGTAFHLPDYPLDLGGIGWCGLDLPVHGLCQKSPPLACYTCPKFAAWRDGPHKEVLGGLENATAALGKTADWRITQELIVTKQAVEQCIKQIEEASESISESTKRQEQSND